MSRPYDPRAIRIAHTVREQASLTRLDIAADWTHRLTILTDHLNRVQRQARLLDKARRRAWLAAAQRLRGQIYSAVSMLESDLGVTRRMFAQPPRPIPTASMIIGELRQIEEEFGGYRFDDHEQTLSVRTDPITLEGVYLGAFDIKLYLAELRECGRRQCYHVIALDPNPAAGSEHVTHPHVSDERLCEGEALTAVQAALGDGRLCDFFLLVRSVLDHYNPESPYVSLDQWEGDPCADCGYRMFDDERSMCAHCEETLCSKCIVVCDGCSDTFCERHVRTCESCEEKVCTECRSQCANCERQCCGGCLEDDLCPECFEEQQEQESIDAIEVPKTHPHEEAIQVQPNLQQAG